VDDKGVLDQCPEDADLEKAFAVADTDKNNKVDLHEFMVLFELIQEGHVQGLGRKTWKLATSTKEMQELKAKREQFRENLEKKRGARGSLTHTVAGLNDTGVPELKEEEEDEEDEQEEEKKVEKPKPTPVAAPVVVPVEAASSEQDSGDNNNDDTSSQISSEAGTMLSSATGNSQEEDDDVANSSVDRQRKGMKKGNRKSSGSSQPRSSTSRPRSGLSPPRPGNSPPRPPLDHNESASEQQIRMEKHGRKDTSDTLATAKDEWEKRDKTTKTEDIGNLGKATAADYHRHDEITAENTSVAELAIRSQKNARKETSDTLSSAKDEWEKRDKTTKTQDIGNLGREIEAQKHKHHEMTVDNTSVAEMNILKQKNARKETSDTLSSAKEEWEKRDKITKTQDIGNLGREIEAQKHKHHEMTVDNTSVTEMNILKQKNARKETSDTLSSAKDEWEKRGGNKTTVPQDIGKLGGITQSMSRRHDEMTAENTGAQEHISRMRKDARNSMSEELSKNKEAFLKRMQSTQEKVMAKFEAADTTNTGTLNLEELRAAAPRLKIADEDVEKVFATIDTQNKGEITMKEFMDYFGKQNAITTIASTSNSHFSTQTASSASSKFETSAEKSIKSSKDIRNEMSSTLSDSKKEWQTRQAKHSVGHANAAKNNRNNGTISPSHRSQEDKAIAEAREELLKRTIAERKAQSSISDEDDNSNNNNGGGGSLTLDQLKEAAPAIKISVEEVEVIFKKLDTEKTGSVNVEDFMLLYGELSSTAVFVTKGTDLKAAAPTKSSLSSKFSSEMEASLKSQQDSRNELSSISLNASKEWQKRQQSSNANNKKGGSSSGNNNSGSDLLNSSGGSPTKKRYDDNSIAQARAELLKRTGANKSPKEE
jgi:Ca2+-binding EF-hand superfamily protein